MSLAILADHMASKGRGPDSMLVHMSPREVRGLQALAKQHGGTLTVNPETGLPEAGFLDKLLPTILGVGATILSGGTITPLMAGLGVGAVQAARTGDLGKGLMAGLGAYGGAGLAESFMGAGASALTSEAAAQSAMSANAEAAAQLGVEANARDILMQRAAIGDVAAASPWEKLSAGAKAAFDSPTAAAEFAKANWKPAAAALSPILADEMVKSNMPTTTTRPGQIRRFSYNPYDQYYSSIGSYEAAPVSAAGGGLMSLAESNEPVVRMADGGSFASNLPSDWGTFTPDQKIDYFNTNSVTPAQLLASDAGLTQNDINWMSERGYTGGQSTNAPAPAYDWRNEIYAQDPSEAYRFAQANAVDMNANINNWFANNPFATGQEIEQAKKAWNLSDEDVLRALESSGASGATQWGVTHGMGPVDIQRNIVNWFKNNPDATQEDINAAKAQWETSTADIQSPYAQGYQVADADTAAAQQYLQNNPDVLAWLRSAEGEDYLQQNPEFDATDIAWTHYQRYGKDEGRRWYPEPIQTTSPKGLAAAISGSTGAGQIGGGTVVNPNGTITTSPRIPGMPVGGFSGMQQVRDAYTEGGGNLGYIPDTPKTIEEFNTRYNKLSGGSKQAYDYLMGETPYSPTPWTPTGEVMKPYSEAVLGMPIPSSSKRYLFDPETKKYTENPDYTPVSYTSGGKKVYGLSANAIKANLPDMPTSDYEKWMLDNNVTHAQIAKALDITLAEAKERYPLTEAAEEALAKIGTEESVGSDGDGAGADGGSSGSGTGPGDAGAATDGAGDAGASATGGGSAAGADGDGTGPGDLATGGLLALARGGVSRFNLGDYSDGGRLLRGPGDGVSDSIPATIGKKRPARLADGEFVIPARIVSELGNGSTEAGARKLYAMMDRVQKARRNTTGKNKVAKDTRAAKYLPA
jgi:hypothetical protein